MQARTNSTAQDQQDFFDAILVRDLDKVLALIDSVDINASQKIYFSRDVVGKSINKSKLELTPLMLACRLGRLDVVKVLVNLPQLKLDLQSLNGYTALHIAVFEGHLPIVKMLIEKGSDVNLCDKNGRSPLFTAVTYQKDVTNGLVNCLLDAGADANLKDSNGITASECASLFGDTRNSIAIADMLNLEKMTHKMLGKMATVDEVRKANLFIVKFPRSQHPIPDFYERAMDVAVSQDNSHMIEMLFNAGANTTAHGDRVSAMYYAAFLGKTESIKALLKCGVNVNDVSISGDTALMGATGYNHSDAVDLLLKNKADINFKTKSGYTALHTLCSNTKSAVGNVEIARLLLDNGADINALFGKKSPLKLAVEKNFIGLVEFLLSRGADIDAGVSSDKLLKSAKSIEMENIIQEAITVKKMTFNSIAKLKTPTEIETAKKYIALHPKATHSDPEFYEKALYAAAYSNNVEIVKLVLNANANVNFKHDSSTALYACAEFGFVELMAVLISHGADVNLQCSPSRYSPLQKAIATNQVIAAKYLLDHGADANICSLEKWGPLHIACRKTDPELIDKLLEKGANLDALSIIDNTTPLHLAVSQKNMPLANRLIDLGADIHIAGAIESTLTRAVEHGDDALVARLIAMKINVNLQLKDKTALSVAVEHDKISMVNMLLAAGADTDLNSNCAALLKNAKSAEVKKALQEAIELKDMKSGTFGALNSARLELAKKYIARYPIDKHHDSKFYNKALAHAVQYNNIEMVTLLLDAGADKDYVHEKWPILYVAAQKGYTKIVEALISRGANVNAVTRENNQSPLQIAICKNHKLIIQLLLINKANIHHKSRNNHMPIHNAAYYGVDEIAEQLLDLGADIEAKAKDGTTPLLYAIHQKRTSTVSLLLKRGAKLEGNINGISIRDYSANLEIKKLIEVEARRLDGKNLSNEISQAYVKLTSSPPHLHLDKLLKIAKLELAYENLNIGDLVLDDTANLIRKGWLSRLNAALNDVKRSVQNRPIEFKLMSFGANAIRKLLIPVVDDKVNPAILTILSKVVTQLESWAERNSKDAEFYTSTMQPLTVIYGYTEHAVTAFPAYVSAATSAAVPYGSIPYSSGLPVDGGMLPTSHLFYATAANSYRSSAARIRVRRNPDPAHPPTYNDVMDEMFLSACAEGSVSQLKQLMLAYKDYEFYVDAVDIFGNTGLMLATQNQHVDMILYLISELDVFVTNRYRP